MSRRLGIKILLALVLLFVFNVSGLEAKDIFVSTTGSDSVTRAANNISNPWLSVSKAFLTAEAGDIVYFRGGTYSITSNIYTAYGKDGTASNPITFKNYNNEKVTISGNLGGASLIGLEQNYIYLEGLDFIGGGFTAEHAIIYIAENSDATNFKATNCTFTISSSSSSDNVSAVRFQAIRARNGIIRNCVFTGPSKNNGVQIFRTTGVVVENCEFKNLEGGIYFKHSNTLVDSSISFSNNYFHDCNTGIRTVSNYATISNNLFVGCPIVMGDDGGMGDGYVGADYNTITHNTFYNTTLQLLYQTNSSDPNKGCMHNVIKNNIFMTTCEWHRYASLSTDIKSDYNIYPSTTAVIENRISYSLSSWQSHNGTDSHSIAGTPSFAGGSGISAYALKTGSIGKSAADDGKDMGIIAAYVGVITSSDTTPPSKPSGVSVKIK